jgi:hypothetical protein
MVNSEVLSRRKAGFLCSGLQAVATYCVPGRIRVVSTYPSDAYDTGVNLWFF